MKMNWQYSILIFINEYIVVLATLDTWHKFGSKCYLPSSDENDFPYIKSDCENDYNGQLMVIKNAYELEFIQQKVSGIPHDIEFFLGLEVNNSTVDKAFTWSDGSLPLSDFWGDGYPENPDSNQCAVLAYIPSQDKWLIRDWDAWEDTYYICERPGTLLTTGGPTSDFKSWNAEVKVISQVDKSNMCIFQSTYEPSKITCLGKCILMSCDMFGFNIGSKSCQLFRVREEPCTTMSYNQDYMYFNVDTDAKYTCE